MNNTLSYESALLFMRYMIESLIDCESDRTRPDWERISKMAEEFGINVESYFQDAIDF